MTDPIDLVDLVEVLANPGADAAFVAPAPPTGDHAPLAFHRRLPGYRASPLHEVPALAEAAGVGRVLVKDESDRFDLPAFKMLGASWASYRALLDRLDLTAPPWADLDELSALVAPLLPLDLATATDGNHGRAVARFAQWLGLGARIFVPEGTSIARITAIESEGASCTIVDGTYDDAVARAAQEADDGCVVVSDTAWPGYEEVPRWVIEGYTTIFAEIDDQRAAASLPAPDVVLVPIGVGALAGAVARWFRRPDLDAEGERPRLIGIEPTTANCLMASARAGELVEVPGPHRSIMAGLNCGQGSPVAWPDVHAGFDTFTAVDDEIARVGMQALADVGIVSGESGACTVGLLLSGALEWPADAVVLALSTEGATDPALYREIVGHSPREIGERRDADGSGGSAP